MREHGILMAAPMILATAEGRKTVTRRYGARWARVQPGDRLWTRETWVRCYLCHWPDLPHRCNPQDPKGCVAFYKAGFDRAGMHSYWKSPLHQPRWAARCLLEVVSVGPGPIDLMDEAEARREGFATLADFHALFAKLNPNPPPEPPTRIEWRLIQGEAR